MYRKLKGRSVGALSAATALALVVVFLPSIANAASSRATSGATFNVAQSWGTLPDNFNPYAPSGSRAPGTQSALYQSLYYVNEATGAQTPLLATGYAWSDGGLNLTVTTRSNVQWSDGQPFSAADVAFTFNYLKANPSIDVNGIWTGSLSSVAATGANTVLFTFSKPDTPDLTNIIYGSDGSETAILPQHIWSTITTPATFANTSPVATGPFTLGTFSASSVTYIKNPNYFVSGEPTIGSVVFSSVDSDTTAELGLENGSIDMSYDYITDVGQTYVAKGPSTNDYYWPSVSMNYLYLNTAKAPFNKLAFRKAIAYAMNTKMLASRAYFGALGPATGGSDAAVVPSQVAAWVPSSLKSLEWSFSVKKAKATLKAAGYKWSKSGQLEYPSGKVISTQTVLSGGPDWTDYISQIDNISLDLKAIGLNSTPIQEPYSTYANDLDRGLYDFGLSWGNNNGATPYYQYFDMFSPTESAPLGKIANTDWERYTSPVITKALTSFAESSSTTVQKADMAAIEKNVLTNVPVVPLTGRANWLVYQTGNFTGFPSTSNPYNDGSATDQEGAMLVYLKVQPKS
jgi:peptide/nickel transport system substrate-binding protein